MTDKITSAGLYPDFDITAYHNDPCPVASLNQSTAKVLLSQSPAHAREQHPRLNPAYEPRGETKFNLGTVAHALLIGRGRNIVRVDADDWRTKDAKAERDAAIAAGKTAVLEHQYATACEMVEAARAQLMDVANNFGNEALALAFNKDGDGQGEVVAACERDRIWLRTMIDWLVTTTTVYDYKTTAASAAPDAVQWRMTDTEWPIQAAMQELILDTIDPDNRGRRKFRFICQEDYPPYALTVNELPEATMHIGRAKLARAIDIWAACMASGKWPAYPGGVNYPTYPAHVVARFMEGEAGQ